MSEMIDLFTLVKDEIFNNEILDKSAQTFKFKVDSSEYVFKEGRKKVKINLIFHTDHISLRYNHEGTESLQLVREILERLLQKANLPYKVEEGKKEKGLLCLYFNLL